MQSIAVIIPTHNRIESVLALLNNLENQKTKYFLYKIVVNDSSHDISQKIIQFSNVYLVNGNGNWWFTKSVNEGIKFVQKNLTSNFILIMNDDSEIDNNYISELMLTMKELGGCAILGSISKSKINNQITYGGTKKINWLTGKRTKIKYQIRSNSLNYYPTKTLTGRGTLIPLNVISTIGLLDESSFPQYGSDDEFALRAIKNGFNVYISFDAVIWDKVQLTNSNQARLKPSFFSFLKSLFNIYSPNYMLNNIIINYRYGPKIFFFFNTISVILGKFYTFLKYRLKKY